MIKKYPFYIRCTVILFFLILLVYSMSNLKVILIPLSFALMLAILLNPLVNRFQKWKLPRVPAIVLAILVALILIGGIGYFLSTQIASFSDQLSLFKKIFFQFLQKLQYEVSHHFNLNVNKQKELISEAEEGMKPMVGQTLGILAGLFGMLFLIPLYSFLFLFYKTLVLNFLYEIFAEENSKEVGVVLNQTKKAIQSYMLGFLLETSIVAILNSIALMILGIEHHTPYWWIFRGNCAKSSAVFCKKIRVKLCQKRV